MNTLYTLLLTSLVATSAFAKTVTFKNMEAKDSGTTFAFKFANNEEADNVVTKLKTMLSLRPQQSQSLTFADHAIVTIEAQSSNNAFGDAHPKENRRAWWLTNGATYELSVHFDKLTGTPYVVVDQDYKAENTAPAADQNKKETKAGAKKTKKDKNKKNTAEAQN